MSASRKLVRTTNGVAKYFKAASFYDSALVDSWLLSSVFTLIGFVAALINGNTVAPPNVTSLSCSRKPSATDNHRVYLAADAVAIG